jgi:hypothetical protein
MKTIDTLVPDIQDLLVKGVNFTDEEEKNLGHQIAVAINDSLGNRERTPGLRMSKFGSPCERKLWLQDHPDACGDVESLSAATRLKFAYGHVLEAIVLELAKKAGHSVERQQDHVEFHGVPGHLDATIDGELVDVKSANSRGMDKFKYHKLESDDPFGYLDQLNLYYRATGLTTGRFHFLAIDKELGHLVLDTYKVDDKRDMAKEVLAKQLMLTNPEPPKKLATVEEGKSGNEGLSLACRYCEFKRTCWPGLRVFAYSGGPKFLTKVVKQPDVQELYHERPIRQ